MTDRTQELVNEYAEMSNLVDNYQSIVVLRRLLSIVENQELRIAGWREIVVGQDARIAKLEKEVQNLKGDF